MSNNEKLIFDKSLWLKIYYKNKHDTWFHVILSNNQKIFLRNYDEWFDVKKYCISNQCSVEKIILVYRSHQVEFETKNAEGVYLVRSLLASSNSDIKHTITTGKLVNGYVEKVVWLSPELIIYEETNDPIKKCFEESIIYNYEKQRQ